jgi:hypothetical protein
MPGGQLAPAPGLSSVTPMNERPSRVASNRRQIPAARVYPVLIPVAPRKGAEQRIGVLPQVRVVPRSRGDPVGAPVHDGTKDPRFHRVAESEHTHGPVTYDPWGNLTPGQNAPANTAGPMSLGAYAASGKFTTTATGTILLGVRTLTPPKPASCLSTPSTAAAPTRTPMGSATPLTTRTYPVRRRPVLTTRRTATMGQSRYRCRRQERWRGAQSLITGWAALVCGSGRLWRRLKDGRPVEYDPVADRFSPADVAPNHLDPEAVVPRVEVTGRFDWPG